MATETLRAESAPVTPAPPEGSSTPAFTNRLEGACHGARCNFEDLGIRLDHLQSIVSLLALTEDNTSDMSAALRGVAHFIGSAREYAEDRAAYFEDQASAALLTGREADHG
jgi:hypothetical protein